MKKTILILSMLIGAALSSCSSGEATTEENLDPSANNIKWTWYYRGEIESDGTMIPHVNLCSSKRDYIYVDFDGITDHFFDSDCGAHTDYAGQSYGYHLIFTDFTEDKYITKLTRNEFHLTYLSETTGKITTKVYTRN